MDLIPVTVSLRDLETGNVPLSALEKAFGPSSLGIIIVKDLPIEYVELRRELLSFSSYLANLPQHELDALENPDAKYLTGWSLGKESLKPGVPDTLKGSYYLNCAFAIDPELSGAPTTSPDGRTFDTFPEYTAPNLWPPEKLLPGFRNAAENLCRLVIRTATLVARACDRFAALHIPAYEPGYLERMVKDSMTTKARLLHYFPPPVVRSDTDSVQQQVTSEADDDWCATHVDHGCLTGLTSAMYIDEVAQPVLRSPAVVSDALPCLDELKTPPSPQTGLYIHSRAGTVTKVSIPRDCLAFQTGEALERITEGRFRAVPHFVRGSGSSSFDARVARNTLAVFTQPNLWEIVDRTEGLDYAAFAREVVERHY